MKNKKISVFFLYYFLLLYLEGMFQIFATHLISWNVLFLLLEIGLLSSIFTFLTKLGKAKWNKRITIIFLFLLTIWMCAEILFQNTFHVYFSVATTFFADQAISFSGKIMEIIVSNIFCILALFLPIVLFFCFQKKIDFEPIPKKKIILFPALAVIFYLLFWGCLSIHKESQSPYELYTSTNNNALNKTTFGAFYSVCIELRKMIFPPAEKIYEPEKEEQPKEENIPIAYQPNIIDLPIEKWYEEEKDPTLKQMDEYFLKDTPTIQNEYTGLWKGKNLILFMAESFNSIAVDEKLTPTLYKLTHEGFVFENFYSPVILSTIGGEFQELTSLYPNLSMLSQVWRKGTNVFPFGIGNLFSQQNYTVNAYHDHKYQFQNRDVYLKSLGFSNYLGCFNGLEKRINCNSWPESDVEMITSTVDDYLSSSSPFFTYYVTVSGHMSYNFSSNRMAKKHEEEVKDLPYSTDIKAYVASQIELDQALQALITKLEESGKLNDTVIALVADHYPYDISLEHINEIANPKRDSLFEINRSHFILWNPTIETKIIQKVGGNMDVLPTLLNLFGIPYDSRLLMGKDLLSTTEGLVIFSDNSWISDDGRYNTQEKKFTKNENKEIENVEEYVAKMNKIVSNRVNMSKLIMEKNYYKKVLGD